MPAAELAPLATTGLEVTRLGLGGAPLGGLFSAVSDEDARETITAAFENGLRLFDTAPFYGHGRSESRFGESLSGRRREDFVIASKVGRVLEPTTRDAVEDHRYRDTLLFNPVFDFTGEGVMRSFEESLARLKLETIDIVHIHDPDDHFEMALDQAFPALARLREQKRIRAIGVGMNQAEMLCRFGREADFDCFLLAGRYTLLDQIALKELFPLCAERNIAVILGGPYNSGILATGTKNGGHYDYQPPSVEILAKTARLESLCARHQVPLKAAALQFPLAHPVVASVIPGARTAAEVRDNVSLAAHPISSAFWQEMRAEGLVAPEAPLPGLASPGGVGI